MPRPPRSFEPGGFYHVTARGNNGRVIVTDDEDRTAFVTLLARIPVRFGINIHAWCLMTNHYHLVIETPSGQVSRAVQYLNSSHARRFNRRHGREGHSFARASARPSSWTSGTSRPRARTCSSTPCGPG